jgi:thioredoxin-like negative regulator of GroEL
MLKQKAAQKNIEANDKDGIYIFTSQTCAICNQMKKTYSDLIEHKQITIVDVVKNRDMATGYKIMSVPTTVVIKERKVAQIFYGFVKLEELSQWLSK